jgi:hypothetical protein
MSSTKEQFFATGVPTSVVSVGGHRYTVRGLTVEEWDRYERSCTTVIDEKPRFENDRALLLRLGVVNEDGAHVFDDSDLPKLKAASCKLVKPLAEEIYKLCNVVPDAGNG